MYMYNNPFEQQLDVKVQATPFETRNSFRDGPSIASGSSVLPLHGMLGVVLLRMPSQINARRGLILPNASS